MNAIDQRIANRERVLALQTVERDKLLVALSSSDDPTVEQRLIDLDQSIKTSRQLLSVLAEQREQLVAEEAKAALAAAAEETKKARKDLEKAVTKRIRQARELDAAAKVYAEALSAYRITSEEIAGEMQGVLCTLYPDHDRLLTETMNWTPLAGGRDGVTFRALEEWAKVIDAALTRGSQHRTRRPMPLQPKVSFGAAAERAAERVTNFLTNVDRREQQQ
jgi:pyruvate/2-oxoglutarate dehydrogenase complex dihydrolipoamide acyltransferase (E2) component